MKLKRNQIIFISAIAVIAISIFLYDFYTPKPIKTINYHGALIEFRADLKEAKNVPVYPSEQALYDVLMNPSVENISIAVKPAGNESYYYTLQAYELTSKLYLGYLSLDLKPNFNREPLIIESYDNISGEVKNPVIALVHPMYSDETAVRVEDHVIFIKAKSFNDLDLAVTKFLMVALKIKI